MKRFTLLFCLFLVPIGFLAAQDSLVISNLQKHVEILASDSFEGRGFRCASKELTIDYIENEFKNAGFLPLNSSYRHKFMDFEPYTATEGINLAAVIEGTDSVLKNEYIVIGAHFDHLGWKIKDSVKIVYHGADDNASGVATLIETGKMLLQNRDSLKRSVILIAFDGEEAGLLGSKAFIENEVVNPKQIKAMFSIDMVGMCITNEGVSVAGQNSIVNGDKLLNEALNRSFTPFNKKVTGSLRNTDTRYFLENSIPAIHIYTGKNSPYHKPEDTSDMLEYNGMADIVRFVNDYCVILSQQPELISKAASTTEKFRPEFLAGLGVSVGDNYHYYKSAFFDAKTLTTFRGGLFTEFRMSKNLMLMADAEYEYYGSKSPYGNMRMHSVTPGLVLAMNSFSKSEPDGFGHFGVGGYYRYNFAGSAKNEPDIFSKYKNYDYGLRFSVGGQYEKFQYKVVWDCGLNNIDLIGTYGKVYNQSVVVSFIKYF